jgi:plastocyanin
MAQTPRRTPPVRRPIRASLLADDGARNTAWIGLGIARGLMFPTLLLAIALVAASARPPAATVTITAAGSLAPAQVLVHAGATVVFENRSDSTARITSATGEAGTAWDSGPLAPGVSIARTFNEPGRFSFVVHTASSSARTTVEVSAPPPDDDLRAAWPSA